MKPFHRREHGDAVAGTPFAGRHKPYRRTVRLSLLSAGAILLGYVQHGAAVPPARPVVQQDIEIVSITELSGKVNGSAVEGRVTALINTGRGGTSTCEFAKLPERFTPGTFSTHT
jgi:hypothetical protein